MDYPHVQAENWYNYYTIRFGWFIMYLGVMGYSLPNIFHCRPWAVHIFIVTVQTPIRCPQRRHFIGIVTICKHTYLRVSHLGFEISLFSHIQCCTFDIDLFCSEYFTCCFNEFKITRYVQHDFDVKITIVWIEGLHLVQHLCNRTLFEKR